MHTLKLYTEFIPLYLILQLYFLLNLHTDIYPTSYCMDLAVYWLMGGGGVGLIHEYRD